MTGLVNEAVPTTKLPVDTSCIAKKASPGEARFPAMAAQVYVSLNWSTPSEPLERLIGNNVASHVTSMVVGAGNETSDAVGRNAQVPAHVKVAA